MRVQTYTPSGKLAKPIFDDQGFEAHSGSLEHGTSKRITCTMGNHKWRVTITHTEYEKLKAWFEKE